jgi:hypothetical protein
MYEVYVETPHKAHKACQINNFLIKPNGTNCENEVPTSRLCNLLKKLTIRESTPRIDEMVINLKHYKYLLYFTLQNFSKRFSLRLQALLQRWIVTIFQYG